MRQWPKPSRTMDSEPALEPTPQIRMPSKNLYPVPEMELPPVPEMGLPPVPGEDGSDQKRERRNWKHLKGWIGTVRHHEDRGTRKYPPLYQIPVPPEMGLPPVPKLGIGFWIEERTEEPEASSEGGILPPPLRWRN